MRRVGDAVDVRIDRAAVGGGVDRDGDLGRGGDGQAAAAAAVSTKARRRQPRTGPGRAGLEHHGSAPGTPSAREAQIQIPCRCARAAIQRRPVPSGPDEPVTIRVAGIRFPMTLEDLGPPSIAARRCPLSAPALVRALWHDATGDWEGAHRGRAGHRDARRARGSTPTCTARRATSATPATGTGAPASRRRRARSTPSGRRSPRRCWAELDRPDPPDRIGAWFPCACPAFALRLPGRARQSCGSAAALVRAARRPERRPARRTSASLRGPTRRLRLRQARRDDPDARRRQALHRHRRAQGRAAARRSS